MGTASRFGFVRNMMMKYPGVCACACVCVGGWCDVYILLIVSRSMCGCMGWSVWCMCLQYCGQLVEIGFLNC